MIKRIFARIKEPTLKINILTIFLVIIVFSSLSIISFTYSRNSQSTLKLAKNFIEQVSESIVERVTALIQRTENLAEISSSLIYTASDFSFENQTLIRYMVSVIRYNPDIYGLYFGAENGSLLEVVNLAAAYQTHFIFTPDKALPPESAYVLRKIDRSQAQVVDNWDYLDKNLKILATESRSIAEAKKTTTDPRLRPWYQDALKVNGEIFWSDVYLYDPLKEKGITVSKEIKNSKGEMIAVIGVDISLELFSHFLGQVVVGKTGKAYILNSSGEIIIPTEKGSPIAEVAYKAYQKAGEADFIFENQNVSFLGSAHIFPATTKYQWIILLTAPMSDFFGDSIKTQHLVLLISLVILLIAIMIVVYFAGRISKPIVYLANETDKIHSLNFENPVRIKSKIYEIKLLDSSIAALRTAVRSFSRYIPKDVVKELMDKQGEITIGGEKKKVAIFFSDIEGFTSIAESFPPEEIMPQLAEYFDLLSKIIIKRKGTIDKYIGDSIMAIWGAPKEMPGPEVEACHAALECRDAIVVLNDKRQREGKPLFKTRFGIASGDVIVGNIGTLERLNYTVMGDSVNIASRLQSENKIYKTQILISENVNKAIQSVFETRFVDTVELKGKKQKINVYELIDVRK